MRRRTGLEQTRANQSYRAKCSTLVPIPSQVIDCANYTVGLIYIGNQSSFDSKIELKKMISIIW